ncbi:MAG: hypothetical protein L6R38_003681 [Xanthoria sp. 2 TBL-2021]|nr:MAG: hypothetical protein L6R38_003681 [Xanthoria sp. 2 TBL-2021]
MSSSGPPTDNGDKNRQGRLIATAIVLTVLASVVVALRMITRIWIVRNVGWDDYTIVCAAIGKIVGCGLLIVRVHYGFGRHKFYLTQWQVIEGSKYSYGEWIQGFQTLTLHNISICFLLLRIPPKETYNTLPHVLTLTPIPQITLVGLYHIVTISTHPHKMSTPLLTNRLASRCTIITGASSGLGRPIALAFAANGAKPIICTDLRPDPRGE